MSIHQNLTYFVPGITSLSTTERDFHQRVAPYLAAYEKGVFVHNGISVPFFISRAKNERAVVVGATGLNTIELFEEQKQSEISRLNEAGFSVIWMGTAFPKRGHRINTIATTVYKAFLTSSESPVQKYFSSDLPKILATHSTKGRITYDLAHEEETNKHLRAYCHYISIAPTFGVGRTTKEFNPRSGLLLLAFAKLYPDLTPQQTTPGQIFLALKASGEEYSRTIENPWIKLLSDLTRKFNKTKPNLPDAQDCKYKDIDLTFGQLAELHQKSARLLSVFNSVAAQFTTTTIVASPQDNFICFKTIEKVAGMTGAKLISVPNAGHYPTKVAPEVFNTIIDRMLSSVSAFESVAAEKQKFTPITPDDFATYHQKPKQGEPAEVVSMAEWLSDRSRTALQRTTSTLYPLTRVLQ